jgi:hypothetical protein
VDFGVGLFPMRDRLSPAEGATLLLVSLIHAWWRVSLAAGTHGNGGGVASAAILGLGWTALTNGYPIMYCPPVCPYAAPLSDVGHVGSIVLGLAAAAGADKLGGTKRCSSAGGGNGVGTIQSGRGLLRSAILPRHTLRVCSVRHCTTIYNRFDVITLNLLP